MVKAKIKISNTFQPINADSYLIMNKDIIVAEFNLYFGVTKVYGKMPYDYTDINEWLEIRARFSCVHDAKKFFKNIGIEKTADIIDVTHCVSLHDTFWVKRKGRELSWENVSPFRHSYSKVISIYALEGIYILVLMRGNIFHQL